MSHFLNESDQARIVEAVHSAEKRTRAEIVTVVIPQSDSYGTYRFLWAGLLGVIGVAVMDLWLLDRNWVWAVSLNLLFFVTMILACGSRWFLRWVIPEREVTFRVQQKAKVAFYDNGLRNTRERTGLLIFISLLEHRVEIIADKGVTDVISPIAFEDAVRAMLPELRVGNVTSALCHCIQKLADVLSPRLPPRGDDTNELPNAVIQAQRKST